MRKFVAVALAGVSLIGASLAGCGRPAHDRIRATLALVPLGDVSDAKVAAVRKSLAKEFNFNVVVKPRRALPRACYYPPRQRYRAEHLDTWLAKDGSADKVLGITDRDISTTAHGQKDWGIAGRALLGGRAAVVSSFRSKERLGEIAIHEVGHTLGLPHCPHVGCVMRDADGRIARIGTEFCPTCRAKIATWLR